jgi:hypothetical protein
MGRVMLVKRICILTLSLLILTSAFTNLCLASSSPFAGADQAPNPKNQGHSNHDDEQSPHKQKSQCHMSLLCCPSVTQGSSSYSFVLDSHSLTSVAVLPQPVETAQPIYHPPEIYS